MIFFADSPVSFDVGSTTFGVVKTVWKSSTKGEIE